MGLIDHAKAELAIINTDDGPMQNAIDVRILEVIEKFANQGRSGFSAGYALTVLKRLLDYKPLTPLTGLDDEWRDVTESMGYKCYQNKRCNAVFKDAAGKATMRGAKVFSDDGGRTWYTDSNSSIDITFPFSVPDEPEYVTLT